MQSPQPCLTRRDPRKGIASGTVAGALARRVQDGADAPTLGLGAGRWLERRVGELDPAVARCRRP